MMQSSSVHPDSELLRAFGRGRLTAEEMDSVEAHVAICEVCREQLLAESDDVDDDSVLSAMARESHESDSTEQPPAPASTADGGRDEPTPVEGEVPPELRNYKLIRHLAWTV